MTASPLLTQIQRTARQALSCGALEPIDTGFEIVEEQGIPFLVRIAHNLQRKVKQPNPPGFNPFLPYDKNLFVSELGPRHVGLLNKFNVVDNHLLIVTREYESQQQVLTLEDFSAASLCLQQIDGLVFYNGGTVAGASQPHKHLQLIPRALLPHSRELPIEPSLQQQLADSPRLHRQPFVFAGQRLTGFDAKEVHACYLALLQQTGISVTEQQPQQAYNLLFTRHWMMLVPRRQEAVAGISFNAMAFAGSLFVKNQQQLEQLKQQGILAALAQITG